MNTFAKLGVAAALVTVVAVIGISLSAPPNPGPPPAATPPPPTPSQDPTPTASPTPAAQLGEWFGPVRTDLGQAVVAPGPAAEGDGTWTWADPGDAAMGWVDVTRIRIFDLDREYWAIELAGGPPLATGLEGPDLIFAHGLVLDTTGDGVADYVVGVDNDVPRTGGQTGDNGAGDNFRAWVDNLATGVTEERSEPPYGYPIDFGHFPGGGLDGLAPAVTLFFISGPADVDVRSLRYYVWTSVTEAGEVVAWDYAPDTAWLAAPSDQ